MHVGNVVSRPVVPCIPLTCLFTTCAYFRNFWTGGMIHLRKSFSYDSYKSTYGQTELNRSVLAYFLTIALPIHCRWKISIFSVMKLLVHLQRGGNK